MKAELIRHHEFMTLMQGCVDGELILTNDEIMDYKNECNELSRLEEIERIGVYLDYILARAKQASDRGIKIA